MFLILRAYYLSLYNQQVYSQSYYFQNEIQSSITKPIGQFPNNFWSNISKAAMQTCYILVAFCTRTSITLRKCCRQRNTNKPDVLKKYKNNCMHKSENIIMQTLSGRWKYADSKMRQEATTCSYYWIRARNVELKCVYFCQSLSSSVHTVYSLICVLSMCLIEVNLYDL